MNSANALKARLMNSLSSVIPLPYMTTEYNAFVFATMMYWVRATVNRWADQSA